MVAMAQSISSPTPQALQSPVQADQPLLAQQHFIPSDDSLLLPQQLHQQPLSPLAGMNAVLPVHQPVAQSLQHVQEPLASISSAMQQPGMSPQSHMPQQPMSGEAQPSGRPVYARHDQGPASAQELAVRKVCRICHEMKCLADYHRNKVNADGHNSMCKTCAAEYDKEKRKRRQRVHEPTLTEKECPHCKKIKPADGFYRYSLSQDGLYNICKVCHADQAKARQEAKAGLCPPAEKVSLQPSEHTKSPQLFP